MGAFLPFTTARLTMRALTAADAPALAAYRSDPVVARYQGWEAPYSVEQAVELIAGPAGGDAPVAGEWVQIGIEHGGELIGDVAVGLAADGRTARVGYTLAPAHQGRGLAREAVGAVVDRLFDELHLHRVEASLDPRNVASARLVEALGFEAEGRSRAAVFEHGEWCDDERYALLATDREARDRCRGGRPATVRLVEITPDTARTMLALATHPTQRDYVASMAESFADGLFPEVVDGAPLVPWLRAVEADGELVGFVMVASRTVAHPEAFLWRFLIDRHHQRRGIGARAITALVEELRTAGHDTLLTSWVPGPGGPEPFYLGLGFAPTGEVEDGEIQARLRLAT